MKKIIDVEQAAALDAAVLDIGFFGNPLLKPSGVELPIPAEFVEEFAMCEDDAGYFIENYCKIISLDYGKIPFAPYDFQKKIISTCVENRFVIIKAPRQCGKTTTAAALVLWHILFKEEYTVAILANKMEQAQEIMDRIQMAYENLPMWLQQGIVTFNKRKIELENGSSVFASATSSSAIRGKSVNLVYMDEFAHIDGNLQQKFFTSTYPVISSGKETKVIITSTPNGFEFFAKLWMDAIKAEGDEGKNDYIPIDVHWSDVPGRDDAWMAQQIKNTSYEQFRQEHLCAFIGSSDTLIHPDTLQKLFFIKPLNKTQNISIFEEPIKEHLYFMSVDSARGGGHDYSAFVVIDVTSFPYRVVATFRDNMIASVVYPSYIDYAAKMYNNASILVETNDIGQQIADILNYELENEGLLLVGQNLKKGQQLGGFGKGSKFGVKTTTPVKRIGCFGLKGLLENNQLIINDSEIVSELFTFVADGPSFGASAGKHDDMVMCLVLFAWASTQKYFIELLDSDARKRILAENEKAIEEDLLPFGFIMDGQDADSDSEGLQTVSGLKRGSALFGNDW